MINTWGITDRGAVRVQNQDAYYLETPAEDLVVAVVCDGMGGARAGNVASSLAVETAAEHFETLRQEDLRDQPAQALEQAAEQANTAVFEKANREPDCLGMGTTMVATIVADHTAYLLNIGDSRAYCIGPQGIEKLTRDHSVVEDLVRRGEITREQARQHPQKNLITRALGAEENARTDLYERELCTGEYVLLCSDGLSNTLTDQELLYEVLHGGTSESCCRRLLDVAMSRGAPDNVTAVLIQIA